MSTVLQTRQKICYSVYLVTGTKYLMRFTLLKGTNRKTRRKVPSRVEVFSRPAPFWARYSCMSSIFSTAILNDVFFALLGSTLFRLESASKLNNCINIWTSVGARCIFYLCFLFGILSHSPSGVSGWITERSGWITGVRGSLGNSSIAWNSDHG